jgi:hypothetical protein
MFKKYFLIKFSLFLLALFCINLFLRKFTPLSYALLLNYNQLYYPQEKIHIEEFHLTGDSLDIIFGGGTLGRKRNNFQVFAGNKCIYQQETSGKNIRLKLDSPGITRVSVSVNGAMERQQMNIDYSPDSIYSKFGNSSHTLYELTTNVPVLPGHLYPVLDWAIHYPTVDSIHSQLETQQLLKDSIKIQPGDSCRQKVLKIARFILYRTAGKEGIPADTLSLLPAMQQLRYIEAGKSKVWCGNFSTIFSFLAEAAGLSVRLVSCGSSEGGVANGIHVFCEVYLREDQTWAYVDLTSRNILVCYGGKWLNAIDLQRLLRYPVQDTSLIAWHYEKDSIYAVSFAKVSTLAANFFTANTVFTFYFGEYLKIKEPANFFSRAIKFFYTKPYYAVYSDNQPAQADAFYLRILTNYLLLIGLIIWLAVFLKKIF